MRYWRLFIGMLFLMSVPYATAEESFGRLFFTLAQRKVLDLTKAANHNAEIAVVNTALSGSRNEQTSESAMVQGYVRRNDVAQSTVWVNGEAIQKDTDEVFKKPIR